MTVEEGRLNSDIVEMNCDNFALGMRVLAVDDDPICLKLLDALLRKCQYHVTTTSQAKVALEMLRENRNKFDLVVSDVHMPDMDGFKLLELVGLEMDLPVIMLSANGDPKLVMKGVHHGACDYLVKPVRIEELRNIWQHVIRKKKSNSKRHNESSSEDKAPQEDGEDSRPLQAGSGDRIGKRSKKRQNEDDEVEEDDGNEHYDPATHKKPRLVWSIELHRKFVDAVHQLGMEKAVPKRILEVMNVEGVTRENVASHLQKYRKYLKRLSTGVATQRANVGATMGGNDANHMRMCMLDGMGDFRALSGSGRLASTNFSPYTTGGMLGRLNSPGAVNLRNLASSQPNQNLSNHSSNIGKLNRAVSPVRQSAPVFQGVPSSLELDQLQPYKSINSVGEFKSWDDLRVHAALADTRPLVINSNNSLIGASNYAMGLPVSSPLAMNESGFVDQPSVNLASFHSEPFDGNSSVQLQKLHLNALPPSDSLVQGPMCLATSGDIIRSSGSQLQRPPIYFPIASAGPLEYSRGETLCQEFPGSIQNLGRVAGKHSDSLFDNLDSQVIMNTVMTPLNQRMGQNGIADRRIDDCSTLGTSPFFQQSEAENSNFTTRASHPYILEQIKPQFGFAADCYDSFDDMMTPMIKRGQDGDVFDGDMGGCDADQCSFCIDTNHIYTFFKNIQG